MDPIQSLLTSPAGRVVAKRLGFEPPTLRRYTPGEALLVGPALLGAAPGGVLRDEVAKRLLEAGVEVLDANPGGKGALGALILDATGISSPAELIALRDFFGPALRSLARNGRAIVLGRPPAVAGSESAAIAQRALEGFTRALGKELRGGSTAHLVLVADDAHDRLASTLRFLASARSAFVDGQVIRVGATVPGTASVADWDKPLAGQVVAVTGAARGIGAAMARTFARDGATVLGIDIAALADDLISVTAQIGGTHLIADVTAPDTAARIAREVREKHGGRLHGLVHNAGITRDRMLVNIDENTWKQVIAVNLIAPQAITDELVAEGVLAEGSRVVGVSSIAGIAGNAGQTNYATSKAGVIGLVDALAPALAGKGITVNAVAPGFIETAMTAKIPLVIREGGRRLSSLQQGGQPVDVAEAVGWLLSPGSVGVTGNVLRVCGQALIGA